MSAAPPLRLWHLAVLIAVPACGGTVVFEEPGDDGGAGHGSGTSATSATAQSAASGTVAECTTTEDCAAGEVCILETRTCQASCAPGTCDACSPGLVCSGCATSSCEGCKDCVSACVPVTEGFCDDDDPCPDGYGCLFTVGICIETCGEDGCNSVECNECATGSCCGCRDCVALCAPI